MQATPSSSKITSTSVLRSTTTTTTTNSTQKSPKSPKSPTQHTVSVTAVAAAADSSKTTTTTSANSEIEEISKKISEHADAIYRTWKCRGLAPTELLEFYSTSAAAVTEAAAAAAVATSVGMSGADLLLQNDSGSTEGLQKLVNSFVIKDKEQRGVKLASSAASNKMLKTSAAKNAEVITAAAPTTTTANKTATQKRGVVNSVDIIKQRQQHQPQPQQQSSKSPVAQKTPTTTTKQPTSALLLTATHEVDANNVTKTLKKSNTAAAAASTTKTTRTTSGKNNACVRNVGVSDDGELKTAATPAATTTTLLYGKKIGGTAKPKTLLKDTEIQLNLGLDLELNNLTLTQTQNLRKIKELLQQEEVAEEINTSSSKINNHDITPAHREKGARSPKLEAPTNNVTITPAATASKTTSTTTKRADNDNSSSSNRKMAIGKSNYLGGSSRDLVDVATTDVATAANISADKNSGNKRTPITATATTTTATKVNTKTLHDEIQPQPHQQQQSLQPNAISKTAREDVKSTTAAVTTTTTKNSNKTVKSTTKESGVSNTSNGAAKATTLRAEKAAAAAEKRSASPSERAEKKDSAKLSVGAETVMEVARSSMPAPTKVKSARPLTNGQDKNLGRPILTRGSVAERVMMFEKCPDVRNSFLNIKRPDPADAPPKVAIKVKLHATPPQPSEQNSLQREIRSTKSVYIPRFYFPHGKPQPQIALERTLRGILSAFDSFPNNQVTKDELPRILKLCGLPFYWRMPVMVFCQQQNSGLVERQRFVEFWKQMNIYCHEAASRFVYILSRGQRFRSYILPEDLAPLVQDVVETHPGLAFLKEATEFHSRYVHTVIARIFYSVNRSWSGKISIAELNKSDLLEIISLLEEEDDINQVLAFFSYEHFYVIYCKFWELDKDHDLLINQDDLARHSDHALSTRIVERIFSGCVTRGDKQKTTDDEPKMSYTDFVWFLLSEEDKRTPTAIEYWFRCMDVDGDGVLSMYELEYFYEEQQQRMESIGIETLPFEDCLCQMLDMIKPQRRDCVTLGDLKRCKMTHVFFDTFFNLEKYLDHEQRDPFASQRDEYSSDWDRFAAQEYELLITEENE